VLYCPAFTTLLKTARYSRLISLTASKKYYYGQSSSRPALPKVAMGLSGGGGVVALLRKEYGTKPDEDIDLALAI